ncbi:MAG: triose-phosphate isomerase family protein [bacterium]|nr:triose-phosphate isomerase family protein [bacterium]
MKYFIANWKSNKTINEVNDWMTTFLNLFNNKIKTYLENNDISIIIAPPYPFLMVIKEYIKTLKNVFISTQDISSFDPGSYTGEVAGNTLQNLVDFAIIGHSERRSHLKESDELLFIKEKQAFTYNIKTIYCVRNENDPFPQTSTLITYEPITAIGTGNNEDVKSVISMKTKLNIPNHIPFIYGGSVTRKNVKLYLDSGKIDGFLIGKASLDPNHFFEIISKL